ncbi:hypothetical protein ACFL5Q_08065, partial [Planctomycetota bacterium]
MFRSKNSTFAKCTAVALLVVVGFCGLTRQGTAQPTAERPQASVRITSISAARGTVKGEVANLPGPANGYVVALYVKTDLWYIHPFTGSAASITEKGQWQVNHVVRGGEEQLGAAVLRRSGDPPAPRVASLGSLSAVAKATVPYRSEWEESARTGKEGAGRPGLLPRQQVPARRAGDKRPQVRITSISASRGVVEGEVTNLPGPAADHMT